MRRPVLFPALACLALAGCGSGGEAAADGDRSEAIDRLAQDIVARRGVPGLALAVVRGDEIFHKLTAGESDLASRRPVSGTTPFQLASTTKLFSSVGVLRLVADGKVDLDDPVGKHLEALPPAWRPVTIRQLLSHTSGLPDITRRTGEIDLIAGDWGSAVRIVAGEPFSSRPGSAWAYTQTNYALLQLLIEHISGLPLEDFLERRFFRPLGMRNTFFPGSERLCAVNYERTPDGRMVLRPGLSFPRYVHAAGGLCSSLDDLIAWSLAFNSGRIIPAALVEQARTPARLADGSGVRIAGSLSYGLGRAVETTPGRRWAGHSGGNSTALRQYLDDRVTIIVLHNGASDPDAIADSVARSLFEPAGGNAQAALWDSAGGGDPAAARAALAGGADVNALDTRSSRNGRYALNWAAINDRSAMVELLVERGAAIDARNLTGFTALHHAAESGSAAAARALLAAGADPSLRNADGETPSEIARRTRHEAVARLIEAAPKRAR